ncbi:MAG: monovalent cation/H(+) antiporter subunit G [Halodesulfurarchaeum sp.]
MTAITTLQTAVVVLLITVGSAFLAVGTIGILRFPDVYNRMHASSKATTLGAASIFLGATVHFGPNGRGLTALVGILFLFLTAPTGAHMISRSAHKMGVPFFGDAHWIESEGGESVADVDEDSV